MGKESPVWQAFVKEKGIDGGTTARCTVLVKDLTSKNQTKVQCGKIISVKNFSTSDLKKHLQHMHPVEFRELFGDETNKPKVILCMTASLILVFSLL